MQQASNTNLIILAGGKSSRMGTDKALLKYKGKTFVQIIYDNLKYICSDVIISSNNSEVKIEGVKTVEDEFKNIGPMGGLYTCLKHSKTDYSFVVSVDTPFISAKLLSKIASQSGGYEVTVVEENKKVHPLIGVYHKSVITLLKSEIAAEKYKIMQMIKKTKHQIISVNDRYKNELFNINSPDDFALINLNNIIFSR